MYAFSRAWCRLHVFALCPDWFISLTACAVIGRSNDFGLSFTALPVKNRSKLHYMKEMRNVTQNKEAHCLTYRTDSRYSKRGYLDIPTQWITQLVLLTLTHWIIVADDFYTDVFTHPSRVSCCDE